MRIRHTFVTKVSDPDLGSSLRNEKIEPINNYNYDKFPQHFGLKVRSRSEISMFKDPIEYSRCNNDLFLSPRPRRVICH